MRRPPSPPQELLFPDLSAAVADPARRLALPFQPSRSIDVNRAARALNVSRETVLRMLRDGLLRHYRKGLSFFIEYESLVSYCDQLRTHYGISARRVGAAARRGRLRDDELLPFPADREIGVSEVARVLDCSQQLVIKLIEDGTLVAYQVRIGAGGCPWRIYRPSVERYLDSLNRMAAPAASSPRRRSATG